MEETSVDEVIDEDLSAENSNQLNESFGDDQQLLFNVLVDGESGGLLCDERSDGIFLTEEACLIPYQNILYFQIPNHDSGDVFEFDSESVSIERSSQESLNNSSGSVGSLSNNRGTNGTTENVSELRRIASQENDTGTQFSLADNSYDEIYEGLFIGVLSFVIMVDTKGEEEISPSSMVLEFQSLHELQLFDNFMRVQLSKQPWRPKRVLLFLNPASGRGKAVAHYERSIANSLRLAGIVADVRITDKDGANSVKGIILSTEYSVYDAIVIVGGDGSYRDAVAAIYEKMHNQGVFDLDRDGNLPSIDIKFAIIPSGSGNGVVHYLTRSFSMENAVAALVLGRTTPLPVVCVRNMDQERSLVGLAIVCVNYGITSDAIVVADRWKFLGPGKYIIGVTSAMLKHRSFRAKIDMSELGETNDEQTKSSCKTIEGEFKDLMMLVNGISDASEVPRLPRTNGDVFVTPGCNIFQQTGFLLNLGLYSQKIYSDPTVNFYKTNQVTFELIDDNKERSETKTFINLDGDIYSLKQDAFKITYFPNRVQAYALGFPISVDI